MHKVTACFSLVLFAVVLLAVSALGQANVTRSNDIKVPLNSTQWIPCANGGLGELMQLDGYIHILSAQVANDNHSSWLFHVTAQSGQAVGQTTGLVYRVTGSPLLEAEHYATDGYPDVYRLVWFRRIVGNGLVFVITELSHITINADGTTTVTRGQSTVECK